MADAPHDLAPPWLDTLFDTIYGAYNTRDAAATARCYTPDVAITINGEPGPADRAAFIEGLHEQWRGFPDVTVTETNRIVLGNTVVTEMLVDGHNSAPFLERPPTGKRWAQPTRLGLHRAGRAGRRPPRLHRQPRPAGRRPALVARRPPLPPRRFFPPFPAAAGDRSRRSTRRSSASVSSSRNICAKSRVGIPTIVS